MGYLQSIFVDVFGHDLTVKSFFTVVGIIMAFLFGTQSLSLMIALVTLTTFDCILGCWAAYHTGEEISPAKFKKTPIKITVFAILASSAHLTDFVLGYGEFLETVMIIYLAGHEFISIMKNAGKMGFSTPRKLLNLTNATMD